MASTKDCDEKRSRESFCFIFGLLVCYCFGSLVLPVVNIKKPRYVDTLEIGKFILSGFAALAHVCTVVDLMWPKVEFLCSG